MTVFLSVSLLHRGVFYKEVTRLLLTVCLFFCADCIFCLFPCCTGVTERWAGPWWLFLSVFLCWLYFCPFPCRTAACATKRWSGQYWLYFLSVSHHCCTGVTERWAGPWWLFLSVFLCWLYFCPFPCRTAVCATKRWSGCCWLCVCFPVLTVFLSVSLLHSGVCYKEVTRPVLTVFLSVSLLHSGVCYKEVTRPVLTVFLSVSLLHSGVCYKEVTRPVLTVFLSVYPVAQRCVLQRGDQASTDCIFVCLPCRPVVCATKRWPGQYWLYFCLFTLSHSGVCYKEVTRPVLTVFLSVYPVAQRCVLQRGDQASTDCIFVCFPVAQWCVLQSGDQASTDCIFVCLPCRTAVCATKRWPGQYWLYFFLFPCRPAVCATKRWPGRCWRQPPIAASRTASSWWRSPPPPTVPSAEPSMWPLTSHRPLTDTASPLWTAWASHSSPLASEDRRQLSTFFISSFLCGHNVCLWRSHSTSTFIECTHSAFGEENVWTNGTKTWT